MTSRTDNLQNKPMHCGAKTRAGTPCATPAMPNGRCRMHGGKSTGAPLGNDNAVKHGIYRATLTDEEREGYDSLELGSVDHELRLARIRLARTLKAERDGVKVDQDYGYVVDRFLGRIDGLERTRQRLMEESGRHDDVILIDPNPDV